MAVSENYESQALQRSQIRVLPARSPGAEHLDAADIPGKSFVWMDRYA
jgi:hypothetical protein